MDKSRRLLSFKYAFKGLHRVLKYEHNMRIHTVIALMAICTGIVLRIKTTEWIFITLCIGIVFITETLNTAIEKLVDLIMPQYNEKAGMIKDISAGAVLIAAIISVITGILIFLPYLYNKSA